MAKPNTDKIILYTDGGSRGNPGPAAVAVVIQDEAGHIIKRYSKTVGVLTNNEAEYKALIFGLEKIKQLFGKKRIKGIEIEVKMDSEFLVKQLNGEYKIEQEHLFPLFIKIWNLRIDFGKINFTYVPREDNKEADRLVNEELDREEKQRVLGLQ